MDLDPEQERIRLAEASHSLILAGFYPVGGWHFMKNHVTYDLSAADLNQLERIEREGLFVVPRQD